MSITRLSLRRQIAITSAIAAAGVAIACTDTTDPAAPALTAPPTLAHPAVALATNTIVFQRDSGFGPRSIYTMNDDGTNLTRLRDGEHPAWSPDHSKIVREDREFRDLHRQRRRNEPPVAGEGREDESHRTTHLT